MHLVLAALIVWACPVWADWLEGEQWFGTTGPVLTVYGTYDIEAFEPVLQGFVNSQRVRVRYRLASSRSLHEQVVRPRLNDADVVFSSAVGLQIKAVNDGQARRLDPAGDSWRNALFPVSLEPIVSVYNRALTPQLAGVRDRADLTRKLRENQIGIPLGVAMYDPSVSGLGYLLATQDSEQSGVFWSMLDQFKSVGLSQHCCSAEMLDRVHAGQAGLAYNVLESYALQRMAAAPELALLTLTDYQLVVPRTVWVTQWSAQPDLAEQFVLYLRSPQGQAQLPPRNRLISSIGSADRRH